MSNAANQIGAFIMGQGIQPVYLKIARKFEAQIQQKTLSVGDKLPSVRVLSRQLGVSISTILAAYFWLERYQYVEARPRSGFYVSPSFVKLLPEPRPTTTFEPPVPVGTSKLTHDVLRDCYRAGLVPLGTAIVDPLLLPTKRLNRCTRHVLSECPQHSCHYDSTAGHATLRVEIAKLAIHSGMFFSPEDVVVTCGAMEALNLSLRAVSRPGDVVAVESPSYFGILEAIESLGLRAIEIPTHPREGMDLEYLEAAIRKHKVRVVLAMVTCHNPLGYVLSDERKKELLTLVSHHDIPIIEDEVFAELTFSESRPRALQSFDRSGVVLVCSSFSKVLGPGMRVGWVHTPRFRGRIELLKSISTLMSPSLPQLTITEFLASGAYGRYIRRLRPRLAEQVRLYSEAVKETFPAGTRVTRPAGGHLLWIQLPNRVRGDDLYRRALSEKISVLPGSIFSPSRRFRNFIRMNCGHLWSASIERAISTVGRLCRK